MKKQSLLLVSIALLSTAIACSSHSNKEHPLELQVATPSGSPATAFYKHLGDTDHLEVNTDPNNVIAYFSKADSQRKDIIVAPTNAGINAINNGANYQIAATLTFGNFYLLATGKDSDKTLNEGDKVLAFQQNGVAGKLFNFIYGDKNLSVDYLANAAAVKDKVLTEDVDYGYVMLAQPVVTAVLKAKTQAGYSLFADMQADYKTKTGGKEITQASLFVSKDSDQAKVNDLLKYLKQDIEELIANPDVLDEATKDLEDQIVTTKLTANKELVKTLIKNNQLGLGYKEAFENKASIDSFVANFGIGETNEEIYYRVNQ